MKTRRLAVIAWPMVVLYLILTALIAMSGQLAWALVFLAAAVGWAWYAQR